MLCYYRRWSSSDCKQRRMLPQQLRRLPGMPLMSLALSMRGAYLKAALLLIRIIHTLHMLHLGHGLAMLTFAKPCVWHEAGRASTKQPHLWTFQPRLVARLCAKMLHKKNTGRLLQCCRCSCVG